MSARSCVLAAAIAVAGGIASDTPARVGATASCGTANTTATVQCLVNRVRASHGLPRVRVVVTLSQSANLRAQAIVRCRQFSHTPCGQSFTAPFRAAGYARGRYSVGENLAWASGAASPEQAVRIWLASPAHRRILLTRSWRDLGVAIVGANGLFGAGATTVWVAQFGRRG